ncbi:MAG: hypothetical protein KGL35_20860 [Bradyrhizobium sp.]|nr:hypothetical protein [Bradyrhizobium sp.]
MIAKLLAAKKLLHLSQGQDRRIAVSFLDLRSSRKVIGLLVDFGSRKLLGSFS